MIKKSIFFLMVMPALVILLFGCETAKGAAVGVGATVVSVADGIKKDWEAAKKADAWMRENLW
jgi:hypothetical protein